MIDNLLAPARQTRCLPKPALGRTDQLTRIFNQTFFGSRSSKGIEYEIFLEKPQGLVELLEWSETKLPKY